tara:strand:+ start:757 stop:1038 length:282 start_codon:yes stop_codon:yes gene_type:complete
MNKAKIYKPSKTAMQSGMRNTKNWILEFESKNKETNPLTGWISSKDTISEVRMKFSSKELAISYAKKNNIKYKVIEAKSRTFIKKSYADNFLK